MMFENNLAPEPTFRSQLVSHLPIALIVVGIAATMVSLHLAATGVIVLAVAHIVVGSALVALRRHRTKAPAQ